MTNRPQKPTVPFFPTMEEFPSPGDQQPVARPREATCAETAANLQRFIRRDPDVGEALFWSIHEHVRRCERCGALSIAARRDAGLLPPLEDLEAELPPLPPA